jgi:hypothetical protein
MTKLNLLTNDEKTNMKKQTGFHHPCSGHTVKVIPAGCASPKVTLYFGPFYNIQH